MQHETVPRPLDTAGTSAPGTSAEVTAPTREDARKHLEKRRGLQGSVVAFVVVNAFLVAIWALSGSGYFWPAWVMAAWAVGIVFQVWDYLRGPVTDAAVDVELRRMQGR